MKSTFEKYKSPENCVFVPPKVNLELWKLLSSWQRKSDRKFMSIQKSLVRTMNASLSILSEIQSGDFSFAGNKAYCKQNSFLGRGRSNPNHESWKQGQKYQKR